jgi:hypothetical protein
MIKQSFLDSLKGLKLELANELCCLKGYATVAVNQRHAITLQARPNTVILFYDVDAGVISGTMAGDGLELDKNS